MRTVAMLDVLSRFPSDRSKAGLRRFRVWLAAFLLVAAAVVSCYFWLDRPIALWVHAHRIGFGTSGDLKPLIRFGDPLIPLSVIVAFALGLSACAGRQLARLRQVILVCAISVLVGEESKTLLKWVFGRPGPETWKNNNVSFIANHDYQFHWFHGGEPFNSFPSGHMTAITAAIAVLWICYPRLRPIYAAVVVLVANALLVSNFHFLGDLIAGGFLGVTVGWMMLVLFDGKCLDILSWTQIVGDRLRAGCNNCLN